MLKSIELLDFVADIKKESKRVLRNNLPIIIRDRGKPSLVLLSFKGYQAIENIFEMLDFSEHEVNTNNMRVITDVENIN
jgi:hypothetical protein